MNYVTRILTLLIVLVLMAACSQQQTPGAQPPATSPTAQPLAQLAALQPTSPPAVSGTLALQPPTMQTVTSTATLTPTGSERLPTTASTATLTPTRALTDAAVLPIPEPPTPDSSLRTLNDIALYPDAQPVDYTNPIATALARGIEQQFHDTGAVAEFRLAVVPTETRFEEIETFYSVELADWRQDPQRFQQETGSGSIEGSTWTHKRQQYMAIRFSDPTGQEAFLLLVLVTPQE